MRRLLSSSARCKIYVYTVGHEFRCAQKVPQIQNIIFTVDALYKRTLYKRIHSIRDKVRVPTFFVWRVREVEILI